MPIPPHFGVVTFLLVWVGGRDQAANGNCVKHEYGLVRKSELLSGAHFGGCQLRSNGWQCIVPGVLGSQRMGGATSPMVVGC